jgi:hypothetical protein
MFLVVAGTKPDVCFVFSSHRSDDKLRRIPALVKNALKPRTLFGRCTFLHARCACACACALIAQTSGVLVLSSSSFGVFGAGGAMTRGKEVTNKQVRLHRRSICLQALNLNTQRKCSTTTGSDHCSGLHARCRDLSVPRPHAFASFIPARYLS